MGKNGLGWAVVGLALLGACDDEEVEVSANVPMAEPRLGGTVVLAGTHQVELRPEVSGAVDALVYDAKGEPVSLAADVKLKAELHTEAGKPVPVEFRWDPELAHFYGEASGALLAPGPVEVQVTADGEVATGNLPSLAVLPSPSHGGTLVAAGDFGAELIAGADGEVQAFVTDAAGKPVEGEVGASFHADVHGSDGKAHRVALSWSAPRARFVGKVDAEVKLAPGPLLFVVTPKGRAELRGRVEQVAVLPAPRIEGTVVAVGDQSVEIRSASDGEVEAVVVDAAGQLQVDGKAELKLLVQASPGAFRPVVLHWDAGRARYVGALKGNLVWGVPFRVSLRHHGRVHHGAMLGMPAVAAPQAYAYFDVHAHGDAHHHGLGHIKARGRGHHKDEHVAVVLPRAEMKTKVKLEGNARAQVKEANAKASTKVKRSKGKASARAKAGNQGSGKIGASASFKLGTSH